MKLIKTKIKDLVLIKTNIYKDTRGFFKEVEKNNVLKKKFIFDCFSFSKKNTLRGLHLQTKNSQAKIITVVQGKILDVVVDLRKKSKTFGKHFSIEISQNSDFSLFIPEHFAHGFLCLTKKCGVYYKCTNYRDVNSETTIRWNDKTLGIKWPIKKPILSKKDRKGLNFIEFK
ncbi:MAG: dTDP-4-dehydrorhamnose 3,5-epimerase [Pelagibacterales bacterium MED-G41]|nr:MAG: dTDP-4-dehydrorhamnose 3,5-epimerase [Pelagibacterales bacterium MED-G41]|tara:strand:- start:297 stop:812 length:516 start_codon:yes stop_codon:yes gene_type:complete